MSISKILFWILAKHSTRKSQQEWKKRQSTAIAVLWTRDGEFPFWSSISWHTEVLTHIETALTSSLGFQKAKKIKGPSNLFSPTSMKTSTKTWHTHWEKPLYNILQGKFQVLSQNKTSTVHLWEPPQWPFHQYHQATELGKRRVPEFFLAFSSSQNTESDALEKQHFKNFF